MGNVLQLMEINMEWIGLLFNVRGDAIDRAFFFGLVGSEKSIPENKRSSEVFIDVFLLRAMVNAVIRGGGKYKLDPAGEFFNVLGMNPELKQHR